MNSLNIGSSAFFDRFFGAWWGAFIGDAMALPVHGYSSERAIAADYGKIADYVPPLDFHPESVLHALPIPQLPPEFDYIGNRRASLWRKRGTHPHIGMRAGASTLPLVLALHLGASMASAGGFDIDAWLERYAAVMTSEDGHADTFIPSIHRRYFENLAAGKNPETNGCPDAHMSDIAIFAPLLFSTLKNPDKSSIDIFRALKKFTIGEGASSGAFFLSEILAKVLRGSSIEEAIYKNMTPDRHVSLAFPYRRWIKNRDDYDAIRATGRFAAIEEAIPLTLYISLKYGTDVITATVVNANIGGETTGRGALIGMLAGAQCGLSHIPRNYIDALEYASEIQAVGELLYAMFR